MPASTSFLQKEVSIPVSSAPLPFSSSLAEKRDQFIKSIALIKRNALAAPFELAFHTQKQLDAAGSGQGDLMAMHYRDEEVIYIQASPDRVTVIFSTVFREETDRIFGKVFLQVRSLSLPFFNLNSLASPLLHRNSLMPVASQPYKALPKSSTPQENPLSSARLSDPNLSERSLKEAWLTGMFDGLQGRR